MAEAITIDQYHLDLALEAEASLRTQQRLDLLLVAIARAEREGFEETREALVEVLRAILKEEQPVLQ